MEQKKIVAEEKVIDKSTGVGILIVDQRQVYMAKLLEERGYRLITWDLREGQMPRGKDPIWCAGVLILPVPVSRVQDLARLEQCLIMHRYDIKMCIGGAFPQELKELLDQYEIPWMQPFHTQRQMPSSIRSRHLLSQKRRSIFYMRMRSC